MKKFVAILSLSILFFYSYKELQAVDVFQDVIAKGKNPNVLLEYKPAGGTDFIEFLKGTLEGKMITQLKSLILHGLNKDVAFSQAVQAGNMPAITLLLQRGISSYEPLFANLKTSHSIWPDTPFKLFIITQDQKTIEAILKLLMNEKGFDKEKALDQAVTSARVARDRSVFDKIGSVVDMLMGERPSKLPEIPEPDIKDKQ